MTSPHQSLGSRIRRWSVRLVLAMGVAGAGWGVREWNRPPRPTLEGLSTVPARRTDLSTTVRAAGETESAESTTIECELERIEMRSGGSSTTAGGASTILWVVDDGSRVKKGDVLCRLDASEYEELVRQQEIKLDRSRSDLESARLDAEATLLAVGEFKNGLMAQTAQEAEGQLKLAESDLQRAEDRLVWSKKMKVKGYVSVDQVASDGQAVKKAELALVKARWVLSNFRTFGAAKEAKALDADVEIARTNLRFQERRFERTSERFEHYKKMVAFCTISAPHDGLVIYAQPKRYYSENKIEAGATVRQYQDLFLLPDLGRMQVNTLLHESVVERIKPGMRTHARVEGLANRELEGYVLKVDPLPDPDAGWPGDVKYYRAKIRLDSPPLGIRPEMTAEVEIDVKRLHHVVAVPSEALEVVDGKEYCYVAAGGALERRPVKLGGSNRDLLEVTEGLEEGEEVVDDLSHLDRYAALIVDAPASSDHRHAVAATPGDPRSKAGL